MNVMNLIVWLISLFISAVNSAETNFDESQKPHVRQKRLIWITSDGRLALPPGTQIMITSQLSMPLIRHPPSGLMPNISIQLPLTIDFDSLGLTDNENPYGALPSFLGRNFGQNEGMFFLDYITQFLDQHSRTTRSTSTSKSYATHSSSMFHGGERALLYIVLEKILSNFGMNGKACLLRAICEVHRHNSMQKYGLVGEVTTLFFTASKSPFARLLNEYVEAETSGRDKKECLHYYENCNKSLFTTSINRNEEPPQDVPENVMDNTI